MNYRLTTAFAITRSCMFEQEEREAKCVLLYYNLKLVSYLARFMLLVTKLYCNLLFFYDSWPYVLEEQLNCSTTLATTFTRSMFDSMVTLDREKIAICF